MTPRQEAEGSEVLPGWPWSVSVTPPTPGWLQIPRLTTSQHRTQWVESTTAEMRHEWGASWGPTDESVVSDVLNAAQASRDDALLDLMYWPFYRPAFTRVRVRVGWSVAPSEWQRDGFKVTAYEGAAIGPGIQCVDTVEVQEDRGTMSMVHAIYVFDAGDVSVTATVDPTPLSIFGHMVPGLHGIVGSMAVTRADGSTFSSVPVPGVTSREDNLWDLTIHE